MVGAEFVLGSIRCKGNSQAQGRNTFEVDIKHLYEAEYIN
jgi:hypothetical protein